jgi:hypothetical protein
MRKLNRNIICHDNGDVLGFYLVPIIHNFEGDVTQGNVEPELLWYAWSWLQVRGALCCRRMRSSSSTHCLSSPRSSSSGVYRHRGFFGSRIVHPSFVLNHNGFFVSGTAPERGLASSTWSISSFHIMGTVEEDQECIAPAVVHGDPTSQADDLMSEASLEGLNELTHFSHSSRASFCTVEVLPSVGTTGTVRIDRCHSSIRRQAVNICSLLHSSISFFHTDLVDFCCVAQLDSSSMGAIW